MTASALIENFLQALVAGILVGSLYGLMCVGLGLIFGVMRVINFAQGEFLMLGMYLHALRRDGARPGCRSWGRTSARSSAPSWPVRR